MHGSSQQRTGISSECQHPLGSQEGLLGSGKDQEEAIAEMLDEPPTVAVGGADGRAQQVLRDARRRNVAEPLIEPGAVADIDEDDGYRGTHPASPGVASQIPPLGQRRSLGLVSRVSRWR